jgi:hypothetical protein
MSVWVGQVSSSFVKNLVFSERQALFAGKYDSFL